MPNKKENENVFIALIKSDEKVYIMIGDKAVMAFKTKREGLDFFESAYNNGHNRGYESSMSACLNWMSYNPSIVKISNQEELKHLATNPPEAVALSSISGFMTGFKTREEVGGKYWESGVKPKLIKDYSKS